MRERVLLFSVLAIVLMASVSAVSLLVPPGNQNRLMDVNDTDLFQFTVRGDATNASVRIFMKAEPAIVTFDNKASFEENVTLVNYSKEDVGVLLKAVANGTAKVTYGFVITQTGGGLSIEPVTQNTFTVVVDGAGSLPNVTNSTNTTVVEQNYSVLVTTNPTGVTVLVDGVNKGSSPVNVIVPKGSHVFKAVASGYYDETQTKNIQSNQTVALTLVKSSSSSSGGGGSGGGGGGLNINVSQRIGQRLNSTRTNSTAIAPPAPVSTVPEEPLPTNSGVSIQDLAGGDSALSEIAVDTGTAEGRTRPPAPQIVSSTSPEVAGASESAGVSKGKAVIIVLIGLMLLTLFINGLALRMARKEENS